MTVTTDSMPGALDAANVMVRNKMAGPTVIAADAKRNYEIIFQGSGHPDGEDVQAIPEALIRTPQFQKALRQGIFEVVEGEDHPLVAQALTRQTDAFARRMQAEQLAAREKLDAPAEADIVVATCIGPGAREGVICAEQVPLREKDAGGKPPLCDRHQHLADRAVKRGNNPWTIED